MDKKIVIADFTGNVFSYIYRESYNYAIPNSGIIATNCKSNFNGIFKQQIISIETLSNYFSTVSYNFSDFTIVRLDKFIEGNDNFKDMVSGLISLIKPTAVFYDSELCDIYDVIPDTVRYITDISPYYKTVQNNRINELNRESYNKIMETISPFDNLKKDNDRLSEENRKLTECITELEEKINSMKRFIE